METASKQQIDIMAYILIAFNTCQEHVSFDKWLQLPSGSLETPSR